ncbi:MAG: hypothetical protein JWO72_1877 [Caulobacteraceae bacterium]|nr:hypothetical protein [Caulobacteraceae bacterium]
MRVRLRASSSWGLLALALMLVACGRDASKRTAAPVAADAPDPGYRAAPHVLDLSRGAEGALSLSGSAAPSSAVRLVSPAGVSLETTADGSGRWSTPLGPVSEPTLYGLSAESDGRRLQAEGYVAILPGAPTVALLRSGAGALVLDGGRLGLHILAVDLDGGGAAAVSGRAPAGVPVRVLVDGVQAMQVAPAADGRFSMTLPKALPPGAHHIQALGAKAAAETDVMVGPIAPPADGPYRVTAAAGGWRVDWITPGGGPQTTLLPASSEPAR